MTSIDEMTEDEAKNYMDTELKALRSILGDALLPISGRLLSLNGSKKDDTEFRPWLAAIPVEEISKIAKKWMEGRSAAH
jgi:hypothetical protein